MRVLEKKLPLCLKPLNQIKKSSSLKLEGSLEIKLEVPLSIALEIRLEVPLKFST